MSNYINIKICKYIFLYALLSVTFSACKKFPIGPQPVNKANGDTIINKNGVFIICEGNYNWANGSVCYYDFTSNHVSLNLFGQINARPLGDTPQSMTINNGRAYIVVNNSHKIEVVELPSFKSAGTIKEINSPRYLLFINETKAYVSSLYGNVIYIINPAEMKVTGTINTGVSTEKLIWVNDKVYAANWSKGNKIFVIDPESDQIATVINTGKEPNSLALDKNNKIWILCSGGFQHEENATLIKFNPVSMVREKTFTFVSGAYPTKLCFNTHKDTLFYLNNGVYRMSIFEQDLPAQAFVLQKGRNYYGLTADPNTAQFYVTNTADYIQPGWISRYNNNGSLLDSLKTDINPGEFCFN